MRTLDIARTMASAAQQKDACRAYLLALNEGVEPIEELEAAAYLLQNGGDYRVSYTSFCKLYNLGFHQEDIMPIMEQVFYEPNVRLLQNRYRRNCRLLERYAYCFRTDFLPFEELPIRFFPYNDHNGYVPYDRTTRQFGAFLDTRDPVVSRNFFRDLSKPILAEDVYSQYELEYLNDNVRCSEDVGRENHLYLHYTNWAVFCAYLQVLNLRPLVEAQKAVFLIEDQISQYPIDFQARYGIDYSQFPVKPIGISDVHRMIWHTQLSTHNGGDFFNEIFDYHPNLICMPSIMFYNIEEQVEKIREALGKAESLQQAMETFKAWDNPRLVEELYRLRNPSDKDLLAALFLSDKSWNQGIDHASRICPALFFQPHFHNIVYSLHVSRNGNTVLSAKNLEQLHKSKLFRDFKYIKTFTPMRRFTTSHGATVKFMYKSAMEAEKTEKEGDTKTVVSDAISERILNRSFMINRWDRLYHDSVLVRFEDGKLNPKATFTALAAFLDLPYTESMTYCSEKGVRDINNEGNVIGFDPDTVYRTYDDFENDSERYYIEYFLRDAYAYYGYDFHTYDGAEVSEEKIVELTRHFERMDHYMRATWIKVFQDAKVQVNGVLAETDLASAIQNNMLDNHMKGFAENRIRNAQILMRGLRFVNRKDQPLCMMPLLKLDPALLERPLYH